VNPFSPKKLNKIKKIIKNIYINKSPRVMEIKGKFRLTFFFVRQQKVASNDQEVRKSGFH